MNTYNHASNSTPEELASSLHTDLNKGLDWSEADARLSIHGCNEFTCDESSKLLSKYLEQFKNPLIQLLLASVVVSIFMHQFDDAVSITLAIIIVVTVAFVQEYRSEKSLKELNKLVPPSCKAIRDGKHQEFLAKYLVPGDIVNISMGDRVPADLRLIDSHDLSIDESNLTGETEPASKFSFTKKLGVEVSFGEVNSNSANNHNNNNNNTSSNNNNSNHDHNIDFSDRSMKPRDDLQVQIDPGLSEYANLAFMGTLVQSGHAKGIVIGTGDNTHFGSVFRMMQAEEAPKSPLQANMDELGQHLSLYSLCIIGVIVLIGWIQSRPILEMFTIGVSLAVAAIPEGLPIVVTVTLALGVIRMAKRKAVVKQLHAVETLGCIHVICSDKTGTLTRNEMTVTHLITSESYHADVSGIGYEDRGDINLCNLSLNQSSQMQSIKRLLVAASLCNNSRFDSTGRLIGQATEGAMLMAAKKAGLSELREEYNRLEEIPFSSRYKFMAVKCSPNNHSNYGSSTAVYYVKGALEIIISKCTHFSNLGSPEPLNESHKQDIIRHSEPLESQGLRVLGLACGQSLDKLTYLGCVGIYDAPRHGVKESISVLHGCGIQIKMVTGDSKITAQSIAKQIGILQPGGSLLSGQDIDELMHDRSSGDLEKAERIRQASVFYRVTPQHKVTIVKMLQSLGAVTAMTGDGVNDGVALKKANIGIAMGSTGTDVCKEAADVILMDDNLGTIVVALEEGKGIYYNIGNFIRFQLSTSIAALSLIALSTILHVPNPLNAMQILYINILMDGPPAQSLGVERVDQEVLKQPPRDVKQPMLTRDLLIGVLVSAAFIVCGTLIVFISEVSYFC